MSHSDDDLTVPYVEGRPFPLLYNRAKKGKLRNKCLNKVKNMNHYYVKKEEFKILPAELKEAKIACRKQRDAHYRAIKKQKKLIAKLNQPSSAPEERLLSLALGLLSLQHFQMLMKSLDDPNSSCECPYERCELPECIRCFTYREVERPFKIWSGNGRSAFSHCSTPMYNLLFTFFLYFEVERGKYPQISSA